MRHFLNCLSAVALVAGLAATPALADELGCRQAVASKNYSAVVTACIELPHGDRGSVVQALVSGGYKHHLGSLDAPSRPLQMLRHQANAGDRSAQYTYGMLYRMVFTVSAERWQEANPGLDRAAALEQSAQSNESIRAEAMKWIERAASQDHTLAMLDVAKDMVQRSYADPNLDLRPALDYVHRAKELDNPLADHLIDTVQRRSRELGQVVR